MFAELIYFKYVHLKKRKGPGATLTEITILAMQVNEQETQSDIKTDNFIL